MERESFIISLACLFSFLMRKNWPIKWRMMFYSKMRFSMTSICLFITESQRKWVNTISSIWHPDPSRRPLLLLNTKLSLLRWILKRRIWKKNYCLNPNLLPCGPICGILLFIQKYLLFMILLCAFPWLLYGMRVLRHYIKKDGYSLLFLMLIVLCVSIAMV